MEAKVEDIHRACRLGDLDLLESSLKACPAGLNMTDGKLGWTGLYRSVICGHTNTVEFLLTSGADPNIRTKMGDTALHQASDNHKVDIARLLLKHRADPNVQQNDGETPLHISSFKGDEEMVSLLLSYKANPNIQNNLFNKTPLHYAVDYSYLPVISLLLTHGADIEIQDKHGKTPKEIARTEEISAIFLKHLKEQPKLSNIASPEPSDMPQKNSMEDLSPILSRSNSDISFTSDYKSVDQKLKQLEDIHKKIREKVRTSVDNSRVQLYSQNTSIVFEPDSERTVTDFVERKKVMSFADLDFATDLYKWLAMRKLEETYPVLVAAGYDDLKQIQQQMKSKMPINENALIDIGIKKSGFRKRLMMALETLAEVIEQKPNAKMNPFRCCNVEVSNNLLVLNMPDVEKWLESLNLAEVYPLFLENGYNDLDQMLLLMHSSWEITSQDLMEIGIIKPGYRHRILSKLKEDSWGLGKKTPDKDKNDGNNEICRII
jgi:ankyrin repeat protein